MLFNFINYQHYHHFVYHSMDLTLTIGNESCKEVSESVVANTETLQKLK